LGPLSIGNQGDFPTRLSIARKITRSKSIHQNRLPAFDFHTNKRMISARKNSIKNGFVMNEMFKSGPAHFLAFASIPNIENEPDTTSTGYFTFCSAICG